MITFNINSRNRIYKFVKNIWIISQQNIRFWWLWLKSSVFFLLLIEYYDKRLCCSSIWTEVGNNCTADVKCQNKSCKAASNGSSANFKNNIRRQCYNSSQKTKKNGSIQLESVVCAFVIFGEFYIIWHWKQDDKYGECNEHRIIKSREKKINYILV